MSEKGGGNSPNDTLGLGARAGRRVPPPPKRPGPPLLAGFFLAGSPTARLLRRPIWSGRATLRKNRRFFSNAAAAERAGFRPCLRCRPELAPGFARIDAVPRLAQSAARRIAAGALNGHGVDGLALSLGVSARQLRRAMQQELGVTPIELAQTHRLLLAKQLLTDTPLPISQVAYASGFQSLRRFNALFLERYRLNPQTLRRSRVSPRSALAANERAGSVQLALTYRPPLAWDALLSFLRARAPATESIHEGSYARTLSVDGYSGVIRVTRPRARAERTRNGNAAALPVLHLEVSASLLPVLLAVSARVRRLFDLDAEPEKIATHLTSSGFGPIRGEERGLRVPGAADTFELAMRAILGQQVSVKGASTLMSRLTEMFGEPMETDHPQLTRLAATAQRVAQTTPAAIAKIGLPLARATTIHVLARHVADGTLLIEPEAADVRSLTRQLLELPGIGPWTAEYIVMRAVHWPDAFPASDLVLRRAAGNMSSAKLLRAAEQWRPWRAYAAMHLWRKPHTSTEY